MNLYNWNKVGYCRFLVAIIVSCLTRFLQHKIFSDRVTSDYVSIQADVNMAFSWWQHILCLVLSNRSLQLLLLSPYYCWLECPPGICEVSSFHSFVPLCHIFQLDPLHLTMHSDPGSNGAAATHGRLSPNNRRRGVVGARPAVLILGLGLLDRLQPSVGVRHKPTSRPIGRHCFLPRP